MEIEHKFYEAAGKVKQFLSFINKENQAKMKKLSKYINICNKRRYILNRKIKIAKHKLKKNLHRSFKKQ